MPSFMELSNIAPPEVWGVWEPLAFFFLTAGRRLPSWPVRPSGGAHPPERGACSAWLRWPRALPAKPAC